MTEPLQSRVQQTVDDLVASGREVGVQVAAYLHGEQIVDACAGVADTTTGRPVTPDTPFFSYSTGKGLISTVVHVLAEQGLLDYDLQIAEVWPEFARHGKDTVTLRHALTQSAGVPALPADVTAEDLTDWDRMCALVADSEPLWIPGARHGYHAWTYGWLVGEVVRRVTGRTVGQVLADEVAGPLGVRDELFLGVPRDQLDRVARLEERNWSAALALMATHVPNLNRVLPPGVRTDAALANRADVRQADIPAVGTLSARAMARMYAALVGAVDGVRLVSPARLKEIATVQVRGVDWTFGQESALTLGYAVEAAGAMFGWSGAGGSLAGVAPELGLAVAVTTNVLAFSPDEDVMEDLRGFIMDSVASITESPVA